MWNHTAWIESYTKCSWIQGTSKIHLTLQNFINSYLLQTYFMPSFAVLVQSLFKKKNKKRANGKLNKEMASTTASSSPSSSSGTNTNSVSHRYDNGRRYQNVEDVAYVLPNDEEGAYTRFSEWSFPASLQSPYNLLWCLLLYDVCCDILQRMTASISNIGSSK